MGRRTESKWVDRRRAKTAKELGQNLANWRKMLNLTSQQVAERANISRTTLSRLENGGMVGLDTFLGVVRALGITDRLVDSLDPFETDFGRLRSQQSLPQRVRPRDFGDRP